jgi:hypothetical protein
METTRKPAAGGAHDAMDSLVATIASLCERLFTRPGSQQPDIAFSDEWERNQINREFHLN